MDSTLLLIIWTAILSVGCLYWIIAGFLDFRMTREIRPLDAVNPPDPPKWPKVSIIIPACDEAETLEEAIVSKLESDYPDFEIIVINDRSTDDTGLIIDRLAGENPKIKAVHVDSLPDGWLGKTHALRLGVEMASGDYFLFTDADVHFSTDAISKAVAYCEEKKIDQLGMMPYVWTKKLLLNATLLTFIRLIGQIATFWGLCKPRTAAFTGVGAFNLVRRSSFEKTDGFEWLKLDITDDVALGMLIKQAGGQVSLVNGRNLIRLIWYPGIKEMTVGLEKGAYAALGNFSFRRTVFWTCMFLFVEMSPLLAILTFGAPVLQFLGAAAWLIALLTSIRMIRWANGPFFPAVLFPVGTIIFSGMLMRAAWLGWRRDGVVWRGTYYSEELLRAGKRFSLP